jgi:apolipoprotein N-acyltransferase
MIGYRMKSSKRMKSAVIRSAAHLLATLASAVLYGLCFPPTHWRALAWVAQVPFLIAVRRARRGEALFLGWVFTVTVAYTVGDWFPRAVATYYAQPAFVGVAFFFGVSSIMAAPYVMAFAAGYRVLARLPGTLVPLLTGAAWVAHELGRVTLLTGNPWAVFGYSQTGVESLMQIADVTGVYGVSFLLVAVNAAAAELWLSRGQMAGSMRQALTGLAFAGAATVGALAYGRVRLTTPPNDAATPPVRVAIIQGNLDLGSQWQSSFYGRNLDIYLGLTRAALEESQAQVVFWPESAMTFFLDEEPLYQSAIGRVLQPAHAELMAGGPRQVALPQVRYYNSTFLLAPNGQIIARYDKEHLLPFAEYFPLPSLDFLRRRFERVREFSAGDPTPPLPTTAGRAGILVCNEAMFPEPAAARVAAGADYLVNPANDTWLGDVKFSAQEFDIVSLRAIEQRRYLVRTSTAGPSAIVDPLGRVRVRSEPFTRRWMAGDVRPMHGRTLYHRLGDLFAALCCVAALAGVLACWMTSPRPRHWGRDAANSRPH